MIAALYVETGGAYFGLPDVEPWDEARDARLYAGPWSVVAHPPCAAWSRYAPARAVCHGLPAFEDGGCFASALEAVRRFGGILEHPARSYAWAAFNLPRPQRSQGWSETLLGEWVAEVDQAAYGHRLRKPTWLYYVGETPPAPILQTIPTEGLRTVDGVTSSWRSPTPRLFRDYLLEQARRSREIDLNVLPDPDMNGSDMPIALQRSHKPKRTSLEAVAVDGQAALVAGDERLTVG